MPAVVLHGIGDLRIEEIPDRDPGPGEVRIGVRYAGICGSDIHYLKHGQAGSAVLREPLVLGHELAGEIIEVGPGDTALRSGQRVTVSPQSACGGCAECRDRRPERCGRSSYLGSAARTPHVQGGMRPRLVVSSDQVVPIPDGVSLARATLAEPLAVAMHAVGMLGDVEGSTSLVVGAGPIGLLAIAALRHQGATRIIARDVAPGALELARVIGADVTELPDPGDISQPADFALECSGTASGLSAAIAGVSRRGRIVQVGMLPTKASLDFSRLVTAEIELTGSFRFENEIFEAVELLEARPDLDRIVTSCLPIRRAREAFELAAQRDRPGKSLIAF